MWHALGRGEVFTGFWLGGPKGRGYWEDLDLGGRITLKWILGGYLWVKLESADSGYSPMAGYCEQGDEP